jgi:hypothetical protein
MIWVNSRIIEVKIMNLKRMKKYEIKRIKEMKFTAKAS